MDQISIVNEWNLPTVPLKKLKDLQRDFKKIEPEMLDKLKRSIMKHGLFVPKFVWIDEGEYYIVDGHQTVKALRSLVADGFICPDLPYLQVKAKTREEAAELLLILNSRYGKIQASSDFLQDIDVEQLMQDDLIEIPELMVVFDEFERVEFNAKVKDWDATTLGAVRMRFGEIYVDFKLEDYERIHAKVEKKSKEEFREYVLKWLS